jgi:hypothetical protein
MRLFIPLVLGQAQTTPEQELQRQLENGLIFFQKEKPGCMYAEVELEVVGVEKRFDYERGLQEEEILPE